jgi:hypothetical protein
MSAIHEPEDRLAPGRLKGPGETLVNEDAWTLLRRSAASLCKVDQIAAALRSLGLCKLRNIPATPGECLSPKWVGREAG